MQENSHATAPLPLIWGAEEIAKLLGIPTRTAFYMLKKGALPARQVGGRWVADREELARFFREGASSKVETGAAA